MADDLDPAAVELLDLDGGLPDVYYNIRSRNDEWTTATGPVPRSTYLMDTEVLLLLVARLEAALTAARRDALTAAQAEEPAAPAPSSRLAASFFASLGIEPAALTVSAEQVDAAWESAAYLEVEDPNGAEFGAVHIPFAPRDRMLRTLAALGIEVRDV